MEYARTKVWVWFKGATWGEFVMRNLLGGVVEERDFRDHEEQEIQNLRLFHDLHEQNHEPLHRDYLVT